MTWTLLERVDPDEGLNRWYFVGVQPGLFDQVVVVRFWGSRELGLAPSGPPSSRWPCKRLTTRRRPPAPLTPWCGPSWGGGTGW